MSNLTAEQLASVYEKLAKSEGGELLLQWMEECVYDIRRNAGKLEPTTAWGRLQFADGLQSVIDHIGTMQELPNISKRRVKTDVPKPD